MEWIIFGILAAALWLTVWGIRSLFRGIFGGPQKSPAGSAGSGVAVAVVGGAGIAAGAALSTGAIGGASDEIDGMNEGDYHSGPGGYSPNTAYPETQYGSGFDEDADWHEEQ